VDPHPFTNSMVLRQGLPEYGIPFKRCLKETYIEFNMLEGTVYIWNNVIVNRREREYRARKSSALALL
jgi:hypothetical protein